MGSKGVIVGMCEPAHHLESARVLEVREGGLPIHGLQPARSELQTQLPCGSVGQTCEYSVGLAPTVGVGVLLHVHIRVIVVEIESDGRKARGADRLKQSGEVTVRLRALWVARDKHQFLEIREPEILEEVGVIDCLLSAWGAGRQRWGYKPCSTS